MTFSVSAGVWVAYRQLHAWRDQKHVSRASDVATELLVSIEEASDQLRALRTPFDTIPQDKLQDPVYKYQKRLDQFKEAAGVFQKLRVAQHRANAVIDSPEIDEGVNALLEVRNTSIIAIHMLAERDQENRKFEDGPTNEMYQRCEKEMYGSYTEKHDPLGMKQLAWVEDLRRLLKPFIKVQS